MPLPLQQHHMLPQLSTVCYEQWERISKLESNREVSLSLRFSNEVSWTHKSKTNTTNDESKDYKPPRSLRENYHERKLPWDKKNCLLSVWTLTNLSLSCPATRDRNIQQSGPDRNASPTCSGVRWNCIRRNLCHKDTYWKCIHNLMCNTTFQLTQLSKDNSFSSTYMSL